MSSVTLNVHEESARVLAECPLFQHLSVADLMELARGTSVRVHPAGDLICARGTTGTEFFLVMSGQVEITVPTYSEKEGAEGGGPSEVVVRTVELNQYFGEIACLEEEGTRTATARTRDGCRLMVVPRAEFLAFIESHPTAAMGLIRHFASMVRRNADSMARLVPPEDYDERGEVKAGLWSRLAGGVTVWATHWSFMVINLMLWMVWLAGNSRELMKELPTMNGLTMWVGIQAIVMTTFVLVAQKRAEDKERARRDLQFQWASATLERINQISERLGSSPGGESRGDKR